MRSMRPRVRPYEWRKGEARIPGAMIEVPASGRQLWIEARDLARVADGLIDALEQIDGGGQHDGDD